MTIWCFPSLALSLNTCTWAFYPFCTKFACVLNENKVLNQRLMLLVINHWIEPSQVRICSKFVIGLPWLSLPKILHLLGRLGEATMNGHVHRELCPIFPDGNSKLAINQIFLSTLPYDHSENKISSQYQLNLYFSSEISNQSWKHCELNYEIKLWIFRSSTHPYLLNKGWRTKWLTQNIKNVHQYHRFDQIVVWISKYPNQKFGRGGPTPLPNFPKPNPNLRCLGI